MIPNHNRIPQRTFLKPNNLIKFHDIVRYSQNQRNIIRAMCSDWRERKVSLPDRRLSYFPCTFMV